MSFLATVIVIFVAALAGLAEADRTVQFINQCTYPIYYWNVGPANSTLQAEDDDRNAVPAHSSSLHGMVNTEQWGGGVALKIRDLPYFRTSPAGVMQVEYNLEPSRASVWYDLSRINCAVTDNVKDPSFCPLIAGGITLTIRGQPPTLECPHASCESNGVCHNTYDRAGSWDGEPSFACHIDADIIITTCTVRDGPKTFDWRNPSPVLHTPPLNVSPNGRCGAEHSFTCEKSAFGNCCSQWGYCGNSAPYCDAGCQSMFGTCH